MENEFKIGDIVDCSGWGRGNDTCAGGKVTALADRDGDYKVKGNWSNGSKWEFVRPDQITRHVPASPVPASTLEERVATMIGTSVQSAANIIAEIRAHDVHATPVLNRPASVGDKLASEMTVRERFFYDFAIARANVSAGSMESDMADASDACGALIAALDKETPNG